MHIWQGVDIGYIRALTWYGKAALDVVATASRPPLIRLKLHIIIKSEAMNAALPAGAVTESRLDHHRQSVCRVHAISP
jgi:hypothetical protein